MVLACLTHWYVSAMFVVPVGAVGGWGWWSSKKAARKGGGGSGPAKPAGGAPASSTPVA